MVSREGDDGGKARQIRSAERGARSHQNVRDGNMPSLPRVGFHAQVVDFPRIAYGKRKKGMNSKVAKGTKEKGSTMRKVRKDSKLHGLAKEQRALVDKWLFDKGLTYQAVAEACLQMFGLKVSRSSVGRYHERQGASALALGKVKRVSGRVGKCAGGEVDGEVGGWSREMCVGMLAGRGTPGTGEAYQKTLAWMTTWALEEMQWPVEDERDIKTVLRFMRILISARRERNEADMMKLAREKFEIRATKECVKHFKAQEVSDWTVTSLNRETLQREGMRVDRDAKRSFRTGNSRRDMKTGGTCTQLRGGRTEEKDPMMMWDFPDGEIKRLPLMRPQGKPAPTIKEGTGFLQKPTKETKEGR
jgi:hypothetical protein